MFPKVRGIFFGGAHIHDCSILGVIVGPLVFRNCEMPIIQLECPKMCLLRASGIGASCQQPKTQDLGLGIIGIMEKKGTTIGYRGYIGIVEGKMEITI